MKKLPISVCVISGAEERRIGDCLDAVKDWTGEIIVVLNEEARDGTEEAARARGARVFREAWKGFIGQKNSAAEKAARPWVLGLDADERVSPELREEIAALFEASGGAPPRPAYCFPRCTFYCGRWIRHGDWYPDRVTRLWRAGAARWGGLEPHARLEHEGRAGALRRDLLHFSNESIDRQIGKISTYSDYFVRQRLAAGGTPGWLDLAARPAWRFLRGYLLRRGFLDGWQGYYIAWLNAFSTLTRCVKVREARLRTPTPAR